MVTIDADKTSAKNTQKEKFYNLKMYLTITKTEQQNFCAALAYTCRKYRF